jgi:dTDP-4-amino-4,6-dideoxygalactose transaminase
VDLLGRSVDYNRITAVTEEHGVPVISDAAESLGASHAGRPAGSFGLAAALSFNGNKIMTTSGGGMLLTDDASLADRVRS